MPTLDQIYETLTRLDQPSLLAIGLAALAGLLLALTPTVLAMVPAVMGYVAGEPGLTRWKAASRSLMFVLGTATTFGAYGLVFGWAGVRLAPLFGPNGYLVAGIVLVLLGLAMLGRLRLRAPTVNAPERRVESLSGAYALGLPFGLVGSMPVLDPGRAGHAALRRKRRKCLVRSGSAVCVRSGPGPASTGGGSVYRVTEGS